MKYYYGVDGNDPEYEFEYGGNHDDGMEWIAEEAAEDFVCNHEGYECSWPLDFELFDENKKSLGVFEVQLEYDPTFNSVKIKEKTDEN